MKIEIKDYCIRCCICADLYPDLFKYNIEKDRIDVLQEPLLEADIKQARAAAADCAVTAIFLKQ